MVVLKPCRGKLGLRVFPGYSHDDVISNLLCGNFSFPRSVQKRMQGHKEWGTNTIFIVTSPHFIFAWGEKDSSCGTIKIVL
jgi:hypothetical protein